MESVVDVVTTTFQAALSVCVIFTAGYAYNAHRGPHLSNVLLGVSRKVLLPCLLFTTFAATSQSFKKIFMLWPIIIIALLTHLTSLVFALLTRRFGATPDWVVDSLTFNNVSSWPILLVQTLYHVSSERSESGIYHLKWRSMDTADKVLGRATEYILVNLVITEIARIAVRPIVAKTAPKIKSRASEEQDEEDDESAPITADDADERTPLITPDDDVEDSTDFIPQKMSTYLSPNVIATVLGLFIGLIKPIQRVLVGSRLETGTIEGSGTWDSIGTGLVLLAGTYAIVEVLGFGAGVRAGEKKSSPDQKIPPTLGTVLIITFWRYICIPAMVLAVVYGFQKVPSTKVFLQDPAFSFVLALTAITPPTLPQTTLITPFHSAVLFALAYVSLITPVALSFAIAIPGRGVSYSTSFDLVGALKSAGGGGVAGAMAMVVQVLALMPLRTIMNYQYRYGGGIGDSTKKLWNDGGFTRYYAGLGAALFQGPLSRFGDTAANAFILALLQSLTWPVLIKTIAASFASACFRMTLTPIDTLKTTQQTKGGKEGLKLLRERIKANGVSCLWWGALATAAATFVGHYPWFGTYNYLSDVLPPPHNLMQKLARQAFIGFAASVVSDTISNSLRVVKTYRQVHETDVGYLTAVKEIVAADGALALFGRGLPTRLLTNGLQGLLFSILWKLFADMIAGNGK